MERGGLRRGLGEVALAREAHDVAGPRALGAGGEEIGELSNMFKRLNTFYQEYLETFLTRFTSMFEPAMLIFMGLAIGVMVIGLFLPIFEISQIGG